MVFLAKDVKNDRTYLYLRHNHCVNGQSRRAWQISLGPEEDMKATGNIALNLDTRTESLDFGLVAALLRVAEKLKLTEVINRASQKRHQGLGVGEHVLFAAINRCVQPTSKTELRKWLESTILQKVYPDLGVNLDARAYWTHFQYLTPAIIARVETELARMAARQFGVSYKDLLFDPTNFFTYANPRGDNQQLARHGHPKDGRAVLNLVNVSLFCALDGGVPLLHLVYPGNVQDAAHFKDEALKALQRHLEALGEPRAKLTLTFDKGNLSEDAIKYADAKGFDFIASDRPTSHKVLQALPAEAFTMHALPNGKVVGVKDVRAEKYDKSRRFIVVYNPEEATWKRANLEKKVEKRVASIRKFFEHRLNAKKWRDPAKVEARCAKSLGKKFGPLVTVVVTSPRGNITLAVAPDTAAVSEVAQKYGKSFLMTSREDLPAQDVVRAYRQQYLIERAFTWLKNAEFLAIRPMYHRADKSIQGHVFTCYVGLLLLSLLARELGQLGVSTGIRHAVRHLGEIKVTRITVPAMDKVVEKVNEMSEASRKIYNALHLEQYL